jgi:hypothetical protein
VEESLVLTSSSLCSLSPEIFMGDRFFQTDTVRPVQELHFGFEKKERRILMYYLLIFLLGGAVGVIIGIFTICMILDREIPLPDPYEEELEK